MDEGRSYRVFMISIGITIALAFAAMFAGMALVSRNMFFEQTLAQARTHFSSIVLARKWNAKHGGVYVEKKAGVKSNPYLEDPDIETIDGRVFTMRNPALMTREMSELVAEGDSLSFHITSLKPLNPNNSPDQFETEALIAFENGSKEVHKPMELGGRTFFRYMAPLIVEKDCLKCHAMQGYKIGDVRGGISVSFDIENIMTKVRNTNIAILVVGVIIIFSLLVIIYFFVLRLTEKLAEARSTIEHLAITDELTGLFNRRHLMDRFSEEFERSKRQNETLGCILIDIDHFKNVNDTYGHITGDQVLKAVSTLIHRSVRAYDVLGRYGGEEFLVLLPETDLENTRTFAERIRDNVKQDFKRTDEATGESIRITISLGVAARRESDGKIDDLLKRADEGLYQAKVKGRDRVESVG